MPITVWPIQIEKATAFVGLDQEQFYELQFTGLLDNGKKKASQALDALNSGKDLSAVISETGASATLIPLSSIQSMIAQKHDDVIKLRYLDPKSQSSKKFECTVKDQATVQEIASLLSTAIGRPSESREEEISLFDAILVPVIATAIAGFFTYFLGSTAHEIAAGGEVEISGRRQGIKRLLVSISDTLGETGCYAIGGVITALCIAFLVKRIVKRPTQNVTAFLEA